MASDKFPLDVMWRGSDLNRPIVNQSLIDELLWMANKYPRRQIVGAPVGPLFSHTAALLEGGRGTRGSLVPLIAPAWRYTNTGRKVSDFYPVLINSRSSLQTPLSGLAGDMRKVYRDINALDSALPDVAETLDTILYAPSSDAAGWVVPMDQTDEAIVGGQRRLSKIITDALRKGGPVDLTDTAMQYAMSDGAIDAAPGQYVSHASHRPPNTPGMQHGLTQTLALDPGSMGTPSGALGRYPKFSDQRTREAATRIGRSLTPAHEYGHLTFNYLQNHEDPRVREIWRQWQRQQRVTPETADAVVRRLREYGIHVADLDHNLDMDRTRATEQALREVGEEFPEFDRAWKQVGKRQAVYGGYAGNAAPSTYSHPDDGRVKPAAYPVKSSREIISASPESVRVPVDHVVRPLGRADAVANQSLLRRNAAIRAALSGGINPHEAFAEHTALKFAANEGDHIAKRLLDQPFARQLDELLAKTKRLKPGFGGGLLGIVGGFAAEPIADWIGQRIGKPPQDA